VHPSQLPEKTATADELTPFLMSILLEASPFISDVPSAKQSPFQSSWQSIGSRSFRSSKSPVFLYERTVPVEALQSVAKEYDLPHLKGGKMHPEKWYLRRSVHEDAMSPGTASWQEWVQCFKDQHAQAEKEFTPTVLSTKVDQEWDCRGVEIDFEEETWVNWTLKVEESVHKLPMPLKKRVFPILQATAATQEGHKVMIVQIAMRDPDAEAHSSGNVRGAYTSIERLQGTGEGIEWIMGTTSDAKGALPAWVQNMAMPGPIAKDVDFFLSWIEKQRHTGQGVVPTEQPLGNAPMQQQPGGIGGQVAQSS
jgi:hypothetical protein